MEPRDREEQEMLEVEIVHNINKNYLVIQGKKEKQYMVKMLEGNSIKGLLDLDVRKLDNEEKFYYDITGKETILQKSGKTKWNKREITQLVSEILDAIGRAREYLLQPEHFVLEPEYIYRQMDTGTISLCYTWNYERNINEQLTELFSYFLEQVDYSDREAVELVYKFYDISREENCTLQHFWSVFSVSKGDSHFYQKAKEREKREEEPISDLDSKETLENRKALVLGGRKEKEAKKKIKFETRKREKREDKKIPIIEKMAVAVVLQIAIVLVLFVGARYGIFLECGQLSYAKAGGCLLICGVLDWYILSKVFEDKEDENPIWDEVEPEQTEMKQIEKNKFCTKNNAWYKGDENIQVEKENAEEKERFSRLSQPIKRKEKIEEKVYSYKKQQSSEKEMEKREEPFSMEQKRGLESRDNSYFCEKTIAKDLDRTIVQPSLFNAALKDLKPQCYLIPESKEQIKIEVAEFPFFIGRFQKGTNQLKEQVNISRMHCKLEQRNGHFFLSDLHSTNGTYVNQRKIEGEGKQELRDGDMISIADIQYRFTLPLQA